MQADAPDYSGDSANLWHCLVDGQVLVIELPVATVDKKAAAEHGRAAKGGWQPRHGDTRTDVQDVQAAETGSRAAEARRPHVAKSQGMALPLTSLKTL